MDVRKFTTKEMYKEIEKYKPDRNREVAIRKRVIILGAFTLCKELGTLSH